MSYDLSGIQTVCLSALTAQWPNGRGAAKAARARVPRAAAGGRSVRTIGIVRARTKIGLQNLAYNIRRLVTLERLAAA